MKRKLRFMSIALAMFLCMNLFSGVSATSSPNQTQDWFYNSRYGLFISYLKGVNDIQADSPQQWNEVVNAFNVETFAEQTARTGAKYVIFGLGQNSGYYCSPNAAYQSYTGTGKCSQRDLPMELYNALSARGVKLMLYITSSAPAGDETAALGLGLTGKAPGNNDWTLTATFRSRWSEVIAEWSARYGDKVSGWWIDGAYEGIGFDGNYAAAYAAAARSGNSDSILCFNPGTSGVVTRFAQEDYTAGELNYFYETPNGRFSSSGEQWHVTSPLGFNWGNSSCKYEDSALFSYSYEVFSNGGVISYDVGIYKDGSLSQPQLLQLERMEQWMDEQPSLTRPGDHTDLILDFNTLQSQLFHTVKGGWGRLFDDCSYQATQESAGGMILSVGNMLADDSFSNTDHKKTQPYVYTSVPAVSAAPGNANGLLLRVTTNQSKPESASSNAILSVTLDWMAGGPHLGSGALLFDKNGQAVAKPAGTAEIYFGTTLPDHFDGYVFMPFTGAIFDGANPFPADHPEWNWSASHSMTIHLYGAEHWSDTITTFDALAWYSGTDYSGAMRELKKQEGYSLTEPQPSVYALPLDFSSTVKPFSVLYGGWNRFAGTAVYTGSALKLGIGNLTADTSLPGTDNQRDQSFAYTTKPVVHFEPGADGIVIRFQTNQQKGSAQSNAKLSVTLDWMAGGPHLGTGAVLTDAAGQPVSAPSGSGAMYFGAALPDNFDGYIFMPYSGAIFDGDKPYLQDHPEWVWQGEHTFSMQFYGSDNWSHTTSRITVIAQYTGTDYAGIIQTLPQ